MLKKRNILIYATKCGMINYQKLLKGQYTVYKEYDQTPSAFLRDLPISLQHTQ